MGKNRPITSSASSQNAADFNLLQECFKDVTRKKGLISFLGDVRTSKNDLSGKYSFKQRDLDRLFLDAVWRDEQKTGGHRKLTNRVTGIVVEYAAHDNNGNMDPGAIQTVFNQVQKHVDILGKEFFNVNSWNKQPDFTQAVGNFQKFKK